MAYLEQDDYPLPNMDPETETRLPEREMRANDENYMTCPDCGDPNFYMGDPSCGKCGWNGRELKPNPPMVTITIYLKGWPNGAGYADAVNNETDPRHAEAMAVHRRSFMPFETGDTIYRAIKFAATDDDDMALLESCFERFNVGDPRQDYEVARYRGDGHRSLSVGDVILLERADGWVLYTCDSFGWKRLGSNDTDESIDAVLGT